MHVIQHLRIEILADDQSSARAWQDDLSRWIRTDAFWQRVSDRLDTVVPSGTVLEISKLELEIGAAERETFLETLLEDLGAAVENHLINTETVTTDAGHLRKAVLYFLANGYLPAGASNADGPLIMAFLRAPDANFDKLFREMFRAEIRGNGQMITRMSHYSGRPSTRRFLLSVLLENSAVDIPPEWLGQFFDAPGNVPSRGHEQYERLEPAVWEYLFQNPSKEIFESKTNMVKVLKVVVENIENQHIVNAIPRSPDNSGIFYIANAGIVILAPFFPQLFNALGWIGKGVWTSDTEMSLAVRLIGYICTGVDNDQEYEWILAKILCGVPPETVIDCQTPLPQHAMDLSVRMMEAAIDQWKVLKSTTPVGLRELFISRDGKLSRDDEGTGWRLQVDKKSQDALLERLPWGIAVIRMPWMDNMLLVEW